MAGFVESGISLDFPTDSWFRFEKTEPHKSISGFSFKEMDACLTTLKGYTKVWDNTHITVMTYEQAKQKLPFVK